MTCQTNILRVPLRINDELDRFAALIVLPASVLCEFGLNGMNQLRCAHSTAHAHQVTAVAASASRTYAAAVARTDAACSGNGSGSKMRVLNRRTTGSISPVPPPRGTRGQGTLRVV